MEKAFASRFSIPALVALFFIVFMTPLMGRKVGYTVDATPTFHITRAIVDTGDPLPDISVKQGYIYSLVYIPFYLIGKAAASFFPLMEAGAVERMALCWMNTVITGLTVGLLALTLRLLGYSRSAQVWIPLLFGFTTLAFAYARYDYNKCLAAFLFLLSFYFCIANQKSTSLRPILFCGMAVGLLAALRLEMAIVSVIYLAVMWRMEGTTMERVKRCAYFAAPLVFGVVFVLGYNWLYWSGSASGGYESGFHLNLLTGLIGFLFSPGKSMFLFNPILLLVPLAIRPFYQNDKPAFQLWLSTSVLLLLLYSSWQFWWGGWCLGARHLVPLLPLLVLPLAALWDGGPANTRAIIILLGLIGFTFQLICGAIDFNDVILSLTNNGVSEAETIWTPIWSPLLHHFLFWMHLPFNRWDYGWVALLNQNTGTTILFFILWIGLLVGLGYGLWKETTVETVEIAGEPKTD